MSWDYAELSKRAKVAGGPEKLVENIVKKGITKGRMEGQLSMLPWIRVAALGSSAVMTATN